MNKSESKLFTEMIIFFFIIVLCFGLLIIKEKSNTIKINKIDKKINEYISSNYKKIKNEINIGKTKLKNNEYYKKVLNKENKDLNFIIKYKNGKISSTYKEDYLEGKSLFRVIQKQLTNKFNSINTNNNYKTIKISYDLKLNNCTDSIKNKLIKENYELPLYTINDRKTINIDELSIQNEIKLLHDYILSLKLTPKNYKLTYTDLKNETKSITIDFNEDILLNNVNIGKLVIENNESELNKYGIKINHLN